MVDNILEVKNIGLSFGGLAALSDLSFNMKKGEIKGLIGPNGAGKSTMFNIIAGVLSPMTGTIKLNNHEIHKLPSFQRVNLGLARTFQNLQIFNNLTVLENVMVGCHSRFRSGFLGAMFSSPLQRSEEKKIRAIAYEKLELLGLAKQAYTIAENLSFGEAKILEIARALASGPDLLLLDEPVAGVPHAEVAHVSDVIRDINREGISVLLVEHNMNFVMQLCDDIVVLNYGKKIGEGTAQAMRSDPEVLKAYLGEDTENA
ncbi:MAG: ABC transporter ATP-binding protein [Burkholderiaceae bacterium]|nr:ABC transporter ATP-binding protein [Burkholderiaceae bacterium]